MTQPTDAEKKQFYKDVIKLSEALLADMPHIGCDTCKAPNDVPNCECECHIDYDLSELNPGSDAALDAGCTCPVLDNHYGAGFGDPPQFWMNDACPIHGGQSGISAGRD